MQTRKETVLSERALEPPTVGGLIGTGAPSVSLTTEVVPAAWRIRLRDLPRWLPVIRVVSVRDFKTKYKQSALGPVWLVIQPLALLLAFVVGFSRVAKVGHSGVPYSVFVLTGLTVWAYFQSSFSMGTGCIIANATLVRRTACPRIAFPLSAVISSLPTFGVTFSAALITAAALGDLSLRALALPVAIAWLLAFTFGVVALVSSITVRFRDLVSALPLILQVGVFLSPVGYSPHTLSAAARLVLAAVNPLAGMMELWRWLMLSGQPLDLGMVLASLASSVLVIVLGWAVFVRAEVTMADAI